MVKRHVLSRLVSPETSTDVGHRHVFDYTQHFGREEHEFGHGVRRHDQASWVPPILVASLPGIPCSSLLVQQRLLVDVHTEASAARMTGPVVQISPVA